MSRRAISSLGRWDHGLRRLIFFRLRNRTVTSLPNRRVAHQRTARRVIIRTMTGSAPSLDSLSALKGLVERLQNVLQSPSRSVCSSRSCRASRGRSTSSRHFARCGREARVQTFGGSGTSESCLIFLGAKRSARDLKTGPEAVRSPFLLADCHSLSPPSTSSPSSFVREALQLVQFCPSSDLSRPEHVVRGRQPARSTIALDPHQGLRVGFGQSPQDSL